MCLLGFEKGVERAFHRRLLYKLEYCGGVGGKLLKWMKEYLGEGR